MRGYLYIATLFLLVSGLKGNSLSKEPVIAPKPEITFTENKGQISDQYYNPRPDVLFSGISGGLIYHLKANGISYQLSRVDSWKEEEINNVKKGNERESIKVPSQTTIYRLDVNWLNTNANCSIEKNEPLEGYNNYYNNSCPNGALDVKSFRKLHFKNIYSGVDLYYYSKEGNLKYDYIISPGADYKQIKLEVNGAEKISINKNGDLILTTPLGNLIEHAPLVKQNGKILKSKWSVKNNVLSFEIERYNPNLELIIDPLTRVWGTYYGDFSYEEAFSCTTDTSGNVFMCGHTNASTGSVIATVGSHQQVYGGGSWDAYLVKFDANGVRQWGTYYGGTGFDYAKTCVCDNNGNVFLIGRTSSSSVIATTGSHQSIHGGLYDAFLVKFNTNGVRLWGTYYGGANEDHGNVCTIDQFNNIYLAGQAAAATSTIIATTGSHQQTYGGGLFDAFVVKFDNNGLRLWGTYYGGSGIDKGYGVTVDLGGNVFLTGETDSPTSTAISTAGSHQLNFGGSSDAFLARFNSSGVRQWGTYYGDFATNYGNTCTSDSFGNVYMVGWTIGATNTVFASTGCHQSSFGGGNSDIFIAKFNSAGIRQWGTFYGGNGFDVCNNCFLDPYNNLYLVGETQSWDVNTVASSNGYQPSKLGTSQALLVKFYSNGVRQWGTYYGGSGDNWGMWGALDRKDNMYICGGANTYSTLATSGSHQQLYVGGGSDGFLTKFSCNIFGVIVTSNSPICKGSTISFTSSVTNPIGTVFSWTGPSGFTSSNLNPSIVNSGTINTGTYVLAVSDNSLSCTEYSTISVSVNPGPSINVISSNSNICVGQTATLTATGANSYTWSTSSTGTLITISPTITSNYTITGMDASSCTNTASITQSVSACTGMNELANNIAIIISPNPNTGKFILESDLSEKITFEIFDVTGKSIKQAESYILRTPIDISELCQGIYFIRINNHKPIKIIKQ